MLQTYLGPEQHAKCDNPEDEEEENRGEYSKFQRCRPALVPPYLISYFHCSLTVDCELRL
jgi:hypothetical protein